MIGKESRGQMTVEAILILTLLLGSFQVTVNIMRDQQYLIRLVQGPWQYLAGMIENGIWAPPSEGRLLHPNHIKRHGSPRGDKP